MLGRRGFLLGSIVAASAQAGCTRRESEARGGSPASSPPGVETVASNAPPAPSTLAAQIDAGTARGEITMETWTFPGGGRAVTLVPAWRKDEERMPLLFALHGRGEANKGPVEGVMGWPRDYALVRAIRRVAAPPLQTEDFEGFVEPTDLAKHNDALARRPFGGLVVVCPYSPDVDLRKPAQIAEYAKYLTGVVLPRAQRDLPVKTDPASTGIDGVSLGGALALRIGLGAAEKFGAVGSLQAAIGEDQVPEFTELAKAAKAKNPRLHLRLLTSSEDYFKRAIKNASSAFRAAGIEHEYTLIPGPHDYPFNRGPGAIEMLLWHDRCLAR